MAEKHGYILAHRGQLQSTVVVLLYYQKGYDTTQTSGSDFPETHLVAFYYVIFAHKRAFPGHFYNEFMVTLILATRSAIEAVNFPEHNTFCKGSVLITKLSVM